MTEKPSDDLAFARAVIGSEVRALQGLAKRLGGEFGARWSCCSRAAGA